MSAYASSKKSFSISFILYLIVKIHNFCYYPYSFLLLLYLNITSSVINIVNTDCNCRFGYGRKLLPNDIIYSINIFTDYGLPCNHTGTYKTGY